jgi:ketosteroid isomerase-like protein
MSAAFSYYSVCAMYPNNWTFIGRHIILEPLPTAYRSRKRPLDTNSTASLSETLLTIQRFNDAFNLHDVALIMSLMTDDCVFENTSPPPDGTRYEGASAVRAFWEDFFRTSPQAHFEFEDIFASGDRGVVRWIYRWSAPSEESAGYIRGVDIFRVRNGQISEKLSYVKG